MQDPVARLREVLTPLADLPDERVSKGARFLLENTERLAELHEDLAAMGPLTFEKKWKVNKRVVDLKINTLGVVCMHGAYYVGKPREEAIQLIGEIESWLYAVLAESEGNA